MSLKINAKIRFGHFFVCLTLSSVMRRPVQLINNSCGLKELIIPRFHEKVYLGKNVAGQLFIFTLDTPPKKNKESFTE